MALTDSLISYWTLDESSGNASDSHGSNTLTDVGSVSSTTGILNGARSVSYGKYFSSTSAGFQFGDVDFCVSLWVNRQSSGYSDNKGIFGRWDFFSSNTQYLLYYDPSADRLNFIVSSDGSAATAVTASNHGAVNTSTWYNVVAWHDATNNQIGIAVNDGTPNTTSYSSGVYNNSGTLLVGQMVTSLGNTTWDGYIDELGVWSRVLTSGERTSLYNSGSGLAYPFSSGAPFIAPKPFIARQAVNRASTY